MSGKTQRCANRAAQALRLAAAATRVVATQPWAPTFAGCAHVWTKPKAVTAAAHKLARLIYTMLTKGEDTPTAVRTTTRNGYRQRVLWHLSKRAEKLGMKLVTAEQPT